MNVVLISIPHTGTWFTLKILSDRGYTVDNLFAKPLEKIVYHGHMVKEGQISRAVELAQKMPLIIPMRHPYRVEESWKRRGKDIGDLEGCFQTLFERFLPLNPVVVWVDIKKGLTELSGRLGRQFETDWKVVHGVHDVHDVELADLTPSEPIKEIARHAFFGIYHD